MKVNKVLLSGLRHGLTKVIDRTDSIITVISSYVTRVNIDNGSIRNQDIVRDYNIMSIANRINDNIMFSWFAEAAAKFNVSGIYTNYSKLYSSKGNDAVQATALNQPYRSGDIAPNERYSMLNPNGGSRYILHPTISFQSTDAWSLTAVFNSNGSNNYQFFVGNNTVNGSSRICFGILNNRFRFDNSLAVVTDFTTTNNNKSIGKTIILTLTANGTGNLNYYMNGILIETKTGVDTSFNFSNIIKSYSIDTYAFNGKYFAHIIRNTALTTQQVANEYRFFRNIYPEISTVDIGNQTWATSNLDVVCTPMGNVINEITDNANVEKVTNSVDRGFDSDTGFWIKSGESTISGGVANIKSTAGVYSAIAAGSVLSIGKYYKLTYSVVTVRTVGELLLDGLGASFPVPSTVGTYTLFLKATSTTLSIKRSGIVDLDIDNVSCQLVGWSGLSEVYDYVYANTSGTATVKDTAGNLAASAWCHYNNDGSTYGSIYGKLYNWYFAKTYQNDIDAYNLANPTALFGYRIPTSTDFNTLQTNIGGSTVAGGKMKIAGTVYWNTPNTGADNSCGFSALPIGSRNNSTGVFAQSSLFVGFHSLDNYYAYVLNTTSILTITTIPKMIGLALRLIKV